MRDGPNREELDIPFKRNGSLVVCTKEQDPEGLQVLMERGKEKWSSWTSDFGQRGSDQERAEPGR